MKVISRTISACVVAASVVALAACAAGTVTDPVGAGELGSSNKWIQMEDGRTVYCLVYSHGISCDWAGAK